MKILRVPMRALGLRASHAAIPWSHADPSASPAVPCVRLWYRPRVSTVSCSLGVYSTVRLVSSTVWCLVCLLHPTI